MLLGESAPLSLNISGVWTPCCLASPFILQLNKVSVSQIIIACLSMWEGDVYFNHGICIMMHVMLLFTDLKIKREQQMSDVGGSEKPGLKQGT